MVIRYDTLSSSYAHINYMLLCTHANSGRVIIIRGPCLQRSRESAEDVDSQFPLIDIETTAALKPRYSCLLLRDVFLVEIFPVEIVDVVQTRPFSSLVSVSRRVPSNDDTISSTYSVFSTLFLLFVATCSASIICTRPAAIKKITRFTYKTYTCDKM